MYVLLSIYKPVQAVIRFSIRNFAGSLFEILHCKNPKFIILYKKEKRNKFLRNLTWRMIMAGSVFGDIFTVSTWGESHGKGLGVVVDGCPAGVPLDEGDIQSFLDRRKPGETKYSTPRKEGDEVEILSGIFEGRTTGTPISMMVRNTSQKSHDYSEIASYYRPGHADYTFDEKYGFRDYRGGGIFCLSRLSPV